MSKMQSAQMYIDQLMQFLTLHQKLAQGHMVDYFTHSLYNNAIPQKMRDEIARVGFDETVTMILEASDRAEAPQLANFIKTAKSFALYNMPHVCHSRKDFFQQLNVDEEGALKLDTFMKSKKSHEVQVLSLLARHLVNKCDLSHLVDIGDGKGYLSSFLVFHHEIPVLGVDGASINTENAILRAQKLEKHWHRVINEKKRPKSVDLYKQVTQLVTEDTDFNELLKNVFLNEPRGIGLVGLHTCGNLGPTSIRIFNANSAIRAICNVSCCYHLLNEAYLANASMGYIKQQTTGYPMSEYAQSKDFSLVRSMRMLSAQSLDRILHNRCLPSKIIFYRALFEIILHELPHGEAKRKNVGKFRKVPKNFAEYARAAAGRLDISLPQNDEELEAFYTLHVHRRSELVVFHLIRNMLAPAVEALILLDRLLFLLEHGHTNVHLVKLFDPVISPRCYALVAYR